MGMIERLRGKLSRAAWDYVSRGCDGGPISKTGVVWCPISREWADRLLAVIDSAAPTKLRMGDHALGYFHNVQSDIVSYLNQANDYRTVTPTLIETAAAFLAEHEPRITQWVAHPWRVASIRAFILRANTQSGGRHFDGWPHAIRKAFILPNGATPESGTTWFRLRNGEEITFDHPEPCLLLFENSVAEHAPVAGTRERPTIEIDIVPARKTCSVPRYAGIDGWYPWFPWWPAGHFPIAIQ
jgi:hypothetical protein